MNSNSRSKCEIGAIILAMLAPEPVRIATDSMSSLIKSTGILQHRKRKLEETLVNEDGSKGDLVSDFGYEHD